MAAKKLTYIKSLDGIRGLACLTIIVAHWKLAFPIVPLGWETLQMFFVMSGYLITSILLYDKSKEMPFKKYAKVFYLKRLFRIFPLYFAYLLLMTLLRFTLKGNEFIQTQTVELEHSGVWLYTYLYNFKTWFNFHAGVPYFDTAFFSHLWSLSVEEQFYMIFPFIIFFLSGRVLKVTIILLIAIPFLLRIIGFPYLMSVNPDGEWAALLIYRNIFFQMDSLAIGAALAIFNFNWIKNVKFWFHVAFFSIFIIHAINYPIVSTAYSDLSGVAFDIFKDGDKMSILGYIHFLGHPEILQFGKQYIYMMPLVNIVCFLMVLSAERNDPVWRKVLENRFIVYAGKISYGMYVFHFAILIIFMKLLKAVLPVNAYELPYLIHVVLFIVYIAILMGISTLSYNYFEMYFLKMKKKIKT